MENKKSKYDNHLKRILKNLLNDKSVFEKKFESISELKEYLVVYTVDEFIKNILKVTDTNYKNELHRILKPHVKKLFTNDFKDLIKNRFELYQNKKKLNEQNEKEQLSKMKTDLRRIRTFLEESSYSNLEGIKSIDVRLPHPDLEDRIVIVVNLDKAKLLVGEIGNVCDSIWNDVFNLFDVRTHVQWRWI